MAWGFTRSDPANFDKTAGTSMTMSIGTPAIPVDNVFIVIVAKDNTTTTEQQSTEVSSVTDTVSNTYTKIGEYSKGGAADSSATCSVWYTQVTTEITASSAITANFAASITAKAMAGAIFTVAAGSTVTPQSPQFAAGTGTAAPSMSISGLPNKEYLFLRGIAIETSSGGQIETAGYAEIAGTRTTGGGGASNMGAQGEWDIATGTGSTSAPIVVSADHAHVFFALEEILAANDPLPPLLPRFNGMNTLIRM